MLVVLRLRSFSCQAGTAVVETTVDDRLGWRSFEEMRAAWRAIARHDGDGRANEQRDARQFVYIANTVAPSLTRPEVTHLFRPLHRHACALCYFSGCAVPCGVSLGHMMTGR